MDYRSMYDREYIGHWDLVDGNGKAIDVTVKIVRVEAKKLKSQRGENKKPVVFFEGKEKGFVCNKTNGKAIAGMYGNDTVKWAGKSITLYTTTTSSPDGQVECIRVRPTIPNGRGKAKQEPPREPGQEG